eukprot:1139696-Pelagomonas_calceolata.AAC.1
MRGMAEGEAIEAHREGVCVCPEDLVTAACAEISVEGTVKFKRVAEHALLCMKCSEVQDVCMLADALHCVQCAAQRDCTA